MIIGQHKDGVLEVVGEGETRSSTIHVANIAKLQYILTEGLYKDAQSAVIAELSNNGVDSIVKSGKDPIENPVIVELKNIGGAYSLSIEDKGEGMDRDFFENCFMDMLYSTKEEDDNAIGHFGLGGKSWASLKRTVTFTIIKNGWKWSYLCWKGEEVIDYDLIIEEETTEEDGVKFEMPINDWREYEDFKIKATQKLAYYDTVALIINGQVWDNKIYRNDLFQYCSNPPYKDIHLCLKDVVYEIDWDKLRIPKIPIPIAIRFGLTDGVIPTPSRESYLNSKETLDLIHSKIGEIADFFKEKYNASLAEPKSFYEAFSDIGSKSKEVALVGRNFETSYLANYGNLCFEEIKVEGCNLRGPSWYKSNINTLIESFHSKAKYGSNGIWKIKNIYDFLPNQFRDKRSPVLVDFTITGNIKEFLKEKLGVGNLFVTLQKRDLNWYRSNVVKSIGVADWRKYIQEWQDIEKTVVRDWCIDYRGVDSSKEFLDWVEAKKQWMKDNKTAALAKYKVLNKEEGEVTIAYSRNSLVDNTTKVFDKATFKIGDLHKTPQVVIVFEEAEKELAADLAEVVVKEKVAIIGKREFSKIKHIKQFKTYSEFMSDNKPFRRIATALLASSVLDKYSTIMGKGMDIVKNCLTNLDEEVSKITSYKYAHKESVSTKSASAILELANAMNLWDEEIMPSIRKVEQSLSTFDFLRFMVVPSYWDAEAVKDVQKIVHQMLLFRKKYYNDLKDYELVYTPQPEVTI